MLELNPMIENAFGRLISAPMPFRPIKRTYQTIGRVQQAMANKLVANSFSASLGDICLVRCDRTDQNKHYIVSDLSVDETVLHPLDQAAHVRPNAKVIHTPNFNRVLISDHLLNSSRVFGETAVELIDGRSGVHSESLGVCRVTQDAQPTERRVIDEFVQPESAVEIYYGGRAFFKGALEWEVSDAALAMGPAFDLSVVVSPISERRIFNAALPHIDEFGPYIHVYADVHRSELFISASIHLAAAIARGFAKSGMDVSFVVDKLILKAIRESATRSVSDANDRHNPFPVSSLYAEHGRIGLGTLTSFWEADLYATS